MLVQMGLYDLSSDKILTQFKGNPYRMNIARASALTGAEISDNEIIIDGQAYELARIVTVIL